MPKRKSPYRSGGTRRRPRYRKRYSARFRRRRRALAKRFRPRKRYTKRSGQTRFAAYKARTKPELKTNGQAYDRSTFVTAALLASGAVDSYPTTQIVNNRIKDLSSGDGAHQVEGRQITLVSHTLRYTIYHHNPVPLLIRYFFARPKIAKYSDNNPGNTSLDNLRCGTNGDTVGPSNHWPRVQRGKINTARWTIIKTGTCRLYPYDKGVTDYVWKDQDEDGVQDAATEQQYDDEVFRTCRYSQMHKTTHSFSVDLLKTEPRQLKWESESDLGTFPKNVKPVWLFFEAAMLDRTPAVDDGTSVDEDYKHTITAVGTSELTWFDM